MINVTKPFLPPKEEYLQKIDGIWERNWLTNSGPLVNQLEKELKSFLKIRNSIFVSNGTIALQLAIKALDLKGQIITTPFSYVATTATIMWESCVPVFVDISEDSFNINPDLIEEAITDQTTAIMATHVFGNPCEIDKIEEIAQKHGLKVIYDAAHAFGVKYKNESVFTYGDVSSASFHATKLYHSVEGGLLTTNDNELADILTKMRSFGHSSPTTFDSIGINGKNSEFHAAMGLCNLKYVEDIISKRREIANYYDSLLANQKIIKQSITESTEYNYAYYPIVLEDEAMLLAVIMALNANDIFPRRYFYPSLNTLHYVDNVSCQISENIASRILCLPYYYDLSKADQDLICNILIKTLNK